ncbi:MAG TPA: RNA 2',3'-cyclic phosphodiesterase [Verrucomicrobiae bacterium]|nr:RNA 2',3'-cyclic phosphodiesterase [Verrucomicrobiae bacterium]
MNDSVRAFISVPVAAKVVLNIVDCQKELARGAGETVRWTPEEQIHLTLQFLGNIAAAEVQQLQTRLAPLARVLRLRAQGIGAFPSIRRPRVIWVGLAGQIDELKQLQAAVDKATGHSEERDFHPHLTIGRVREGRQPKLAFDPWKDQHFGEWEVRELLLMQSKLSPKGAAHSVLARFNV